MAGEKTIQKAPISLPYDGGVLCQVSRQPVLQYIRDLAETIYHIGISTAQPRKLFTFHPDRSVLRILHLFIGKRSRFKMFT